jgi:rRNA maturation endonuclease Nob1
MNLTETYQLTCHQCCSRVEIPVSVPHVCVRCGTPLRIEWVEGRAELASQVSTEKPEEIPDAA